MTTASEAPYLEETVTTIERRYNPKYGNDRICQCGHTYYRHFDSWEEMSNVGCKYCYCCNFVEFDGNYSKVVDEVQSKVPEEYKNLMNLDSLDYDEKWIEQTLLELHYRYCVNNYDL